MEEITEADCIEYIFDVVINRTYDGYTTEIKTIHGQLQEEIDEKIRQTPDEWDRLFKPVSGVVHDPQIHKERGLQELTHRKFKDKYGGQVFYVYSVKEGTRKKILDTSVIDEIKAEIQRVRSFRKI